MRLHPVAAGLLALLTSATALATGNTTFSVRTYVEHDDNVSLVSDDAFAAEPLSSTGAGVLFTVGHSFLRTPALELRGSLAGFHTAQLSSGAEDFDVTGVLPRLSLIHRTRFAGKPASVTASLSLRRDWLSGEGFSRLVDIGGSYLVSVTPAWSLGPSYAVSSRDYDDEGFDPDITSRNALRQTLGLTSQWLFAAPARARTPARLALTLSSQRNAADGSDFEFQGAVYGAQLDLPLSARSNKAFSDWGLQLALSLVDVDYDDFQALPARRDRRLTGSLMLRTQLRALGALDFTYSRLDFDSNRAEFAAQRNLLRLGITHTF